MWILWVQLPGFTPQPRLPWREWELVVSVCDRAVFLPSTCPPAFGILTCRDLFPVDIYCPAALQLNLYYF